MATRRRGSSRRRFQSSQDWGKVGGATLIAVALIVVTTLMILRTRATPTPRDPETLCPENGAPSQVTVIFVDSTDRVEATSRLNILGRLDDLVSNSRPDEMMLVYETSSSPEETAAPLLTVCNPGDPDEANPLISNPQLIRRRLEERFRRPLAKLFEDLLDAEATPTSMLMETIQGISVTLLTLQKYADVPKRVILISDLMQHSESLSLYYQSLNYENFTGTPGAKTLETDLENASVHIFFIQRDDHLKLDVRQLIDFWGLWIDAQDGRLEEVNRIQGVSSRF